MAAKKKSLVLLLISAIILILLYVIFLKAQLNPGGIKIETSSMIKYDIAPKAVFEVHSGAIVQCSPNSIIFLDKKGAATQTIPINASNPIIKKAGDYMMVADIGGKDVYIFENQIKKWQKQFENDIINVDINQNGYATVVHEEKNCRDAVTVFNSQGVEIFTTGKADDFLFAASVFPSNKKVALNVVNTSGTKVGTMVELTDALGKVLANSSSQGTVLQYTVPVDDKNMFMAGGNQVFLFDGNGKVVWNKTLDGTIRDQTLTSNKRMVFAVSGANGNTIEAYETSGKKVFSYKADADIKMIKSIKDVIAVNTGKEVLFINSGGRLINKYVVPSEVIAVGLYNTSEAALITGSGIYIKGF